MARIGLIDNIAILLLSVLSQWVVKTDFMSSKECLHLVLIAVQHVCDNISVMSLVSSGCLTGSRSVWSHAPHSTIYHLVFVI